MAFDFVAQRMVPHVVTNLRRPWMMDWVVTPSFDRTVNRGYIG
jgi:hypothetical protein